MKQTKQIKNGSLRLAVGRLLLIVFFIMSHTIQAQVTIGTGEEPDAGALLDLKENSNGTSTKGLLLPRVYLARPDLPIPLSEHRQGMLVYNLTENPQASLAGSVYFNDGYKWNNVSVSAGEDDYKLKEAVTLNDYSGVVIPYNIPDDHNTYVQGMPISSLWYPVFETSINISSQRNKLLATVQLPVQTYNYGGLQHTLSFAVGLFIGDRLQAVRLDMVPISGNFSFFQRQIQLLAEDLPVGANTVKLCFLKRKGVKTGTNIDHIYVGEKYYGAPNTNDFMLKPSMDYWLFESDH